MKHTCLFIAVRLLGITDRLYATVRQSGEVFGSVKNMKASHLSTGFRSKIHACTVVCKILEFLFKTNFYLKNGKKNIRFR